MKKARKKKSRARRNAGIFSFRKTKKALGKLGVKPKSSKRRKYTMRPGTASSHAARILADEKRRMKQVARARRRQAHAARAAARRSNPPVKPGKTGRWYKGPRGVKVRVRRVRGKTIVDVKP